MIGTIVKKASIYLTASYLSASFFSEALLTELSVVGGILIASSGISILKIKDIKTMNMLPALLVPILFFAVRELLGL